MSDGEDNATATPADVNLNALFTQLAVTQKQMAEHQILQAQQLNALTTLLQQQNMPTVNVQQSLDPERLMSELEKSMKTFNYAPEDNETFESWYARYEQVFVFDADKLDDAAKVRLLIRKLSSEVYNRYSAMILPKKTHEIEFTPTVAKLTNSSAAQNLNFQFDWIA